MRPTLYPSVNDITMVTPTRITDSGVYVKLLEYNNIEGLIILKEISKSRIRSMNKVVPIGKKFPACVQLVDDKTNNITLSKKTVSKSELDICQCNYKILKQIHALVNLFIRKLKTDHNIIIDETTVYQKFIWLIGNDPNLLIVALKVASKDFLKVYEDKLQSVDQIWIGCFQKVLELKFKTKDVTLEAVLEICCFESGGINIIKNALIAGSIMATIEHPFKIKLVKSPYYSITIKTSNPEQAIQLINQVIESIKVDLVKNRASFKVVKLPEIIVDKEFEPEKSESNSSDYD